MNSTPQVEFSQHLTPGICSPLQEIGTTANLKSHHHPSKMKTNPLHLLTDHEVSRKNRIDAAACRTCGAGAKKGHFLNPKKCGPISIFSKKRVFRKYWNLVAFSSKREYFGSFQNMSFRARKKTQQVECWARVGPRLARVDTNFSKKKTSRGLTWEILPASATQEEQESSLIPRP